MKHEDLGNHLLHADTTSFNVHGEYESDYDEDRKSIEITLGHSKDGRMDLNHIEHMDQRYKACGYKRLRLIPTLR